MSTRRKRPPIPATAEGRAAAACDLLRSGRQLLQAAIAGLEHGSWSRQLSEHADRLLAALPLERFASAPTQACADELDEALHIVVAVMRGAWLSEKEEQVADQALVAQLLAAWHAVDDGQTMLDTLDDPGLPDGGLRPAAPPADGPAQDEMPATSTAPPTDEQQRTRLACRAVCQLDALTGLMVREVQRLPHDSFTLSAQGTLLRMLELNSVAITVLSGDDEHPAEDLRAVVDGPRYLQPDHRGPNP